MISSVSDYKFVIGADIDSDHPHGDMDRIIIDGDIMPLREGTVSPTTGVDRSRILRGEDICFIYEALAEIVRFFSTISVPYGIQELSGTSFAPAAYPSSGTAVFSRKVGATAGVGFDPTTTAGARGGLRGIYETLILMYSSAGGCLFKLLKSSPPVDVLAYGDAAYHNPSYSATELRDAILQHIPSSTPGDKLRLDYVSCYFDILSTYLNRVAAIFTPSSMLVWNVTEDLGPTSPVAPTPYATHTASCIVSCSSGSTGWAYKAYVELPRSFEVTAPSWSSYEIVAYYKCSWSSYESQASGSATYARVVSAPENINQSVIDEIMGLLGVTAPSPQVGESFVWSFSMDVSYVVRSKVFDNRLDWSST